MTADTKKTAKSHDDVLEEIADALDIPPSKYEEAKKRYESIGAWLDRDKSSLAGFDPEISPQGSFLLGTVTRPVTGAEEYDVDLVCLLGGTKQEFTQKSLKEAVGREVAIYTEAHGMDNPPEEGAALLDAPLCRRRAVSHGYPARAARCAAIPSHAQGTWVRRARGRPYLDRAGHRHHGQDLTAICSL